MKSFHSFFIVIVSAFFFLGCSSVGQNPPSAGHYYVKYRSTCNRSLGKDYYLVMSYQDCDGGKSVRTAGKEQEVVIGPVSKGFVASASSYHTGMPSPMNAAGITVQTEIWVSIDNEPFTLKRSVNHVGDIGSRQSATYEIQ